MADSLHYQEHLRCRKAAVRASVLAAIVLSAAVTITWLLPKERPFDLVIVASWAVSLSMAMIALVTWKDARTRMRQMLEPWV